MGSRLSISGRGGLGRFLFGLAAVIVALPGDAFARGYVVRLAESGEEQKWACALYPKCRQVVHVQDSENRCSVHKNQPMSIPVVREDS